MSRAAKYIPEALLPELQREVEAAETPMEVLAARAGMSYHTFKRRTRELGWMAKHVDRLGRRRKPAKSKTAALKKARLDVQVSAALNAVPLEREPDDGPTLALRIRGQIDRELTAIERMRETIDPADLTKLEAVGRMLMGLVRTLQEIARLEQAAAPPPPAKDADDFPREYAELRRSLLQHLDAIFAERESEVSGEPASA